MGRFIGFAQWGSYLTEQCVDNVSCGALKLLVAHCPSLPSVGKTDHGGGSGSRSPPDAHCQHAHSHTS